ncbi:MAG: hypothetical protein ACUVV0_04940 [Anaerolineae bacterium]
MSYLGFARKFELYWFLAAILTVFAFAPLTYPGFFQSHSGLLPIYNLYDLEAHPGDFVWAPMVGYSYHLFRSEGALPYYMAEIFRALGASGAAAIKWVYALSFIIGTCSMYGWARDISGREGALLSAVVYAYAPYHLVVVYVRGSFSEALFFALLPSLFWAFRLALQQKDGVGRHSLRYGYLFVGLLLLLALGHTKLGLTALCLPLLIGYAAVESPSWRTFAQAGFILLFLAFSIFLAAHFGWGGGEEKWEDFAGHFLYPFQLFAVAWGFGASVPGWRDEMSFQLGFVPLGLSLLTVLFLLCRRAERRVQLAIILWAAVVAVAVFLALWPGASLWRIAGIYHLVSHPWQVLAFTVLGLSFLAGAAVGMEERLKDFPLLAALVALAVLGSYNYLSPRFFDFEINFTPQAEKPHSINMEPKGPPRAIFGENQIALLEERLEGPLRHGATIRLNVLWQALCPLRKDYTVFVHVVDGNGNIWGQHDAEPQEGQHPTSEWGLGEIFWDRYELQIDARGPREGYHLEVGLYEPETGQRLRVGLDDKVVIGEWRMENGE